MALLDQHFIEVAVEGVAKFDLTARRIAISMAGEHDISPAGADVVGKSDDAIRHRVNRVAEIFVAAGSAIPVLAVMLGLLQAQATRFVIAVGIGFAHGEIKAIGQVDFRFGKRAERREKKHRKERPESDPSHVACGHWSIVHPRDGQAASVKKATSRLGGRFGIF